MEEPKVALEAAESEFQRFIETMELCADEDKLNAEERESFNSLKKTLVRAVMNGSLVFDEAALPVFTPRFGDGKALRWRLPIGGTLMALDGFKDGQNVHRLHSYIAACLGVSAGQIAKLDDRDGVVLRSLANLFLTRK